MEPAGLDDFDALFEPLRGEFLDLTDARVVSIEEGLTSNRPDAALALVVRQAHTVRGAAATLGFPEVGEAAAACEHLAAHAGGRVTPALLAAVDRLREVMTLARRGRPA